jgi:hypothetical protein
LPPSNQPGGPHDARLSHHHGRRTPNILS